MYVTMMMTDQIPLELPPLLNGEVAMMPHIVNGDGSQQVSELCRKRLLQINCLWPPRGFEDVEEEPWLPHALGRTGYFLEGRNLPLRCKDFQKQ